MKLEFSQPDPPLLSVVMVTYGGWDWPRRALQALLEFTDPVYEVILVDNASPDETPRRLAEEVRGARLILNHRNLGFASAANQGAAEASGRYLCFLNPDALVQPGWLPPLLQTLEGHSEAGAVVPLFLAPDGRVDEAGSLIDRDARTLAYGRDEDPSDPRLGFRRVIDYGSAACLIVPTWAFRRAGGFDPVFHPAYCEDVDLLLSFRSMGLVTVFEPRSRVIHARTGSTDDVVRGSLIERNRPILLERWREELANRPALIDADGHPHRVVTLRDAVAPVRLLITTEHGSDRALESLAGRLAESRTDIRVTLMRLAREDGEGATEPGKDLLDPLEQGVEAVEPPDPAAWLEQRRLHYTAAFLDGPRVAGRLWEGLGRSQPGVFLAYTPANVPEPMHPRGATGWRAAEVAAIRAATAILYRNESERRVVPLVDPDVPTFMLDDENSLADLLPLLGIAPPERAAAPA